MKLETVESALYECYSEDLCYYKVKQNWSEKNRACGMCTISTLIINDYFGGEICKIHVEGVSHYFNLLEGEIVDVTARQFSEKIDYNGYETVIRDKFLNEDTKIRYEILKKKLINLLLKQIDEKVYECNVCEKLVDKFPNDATVFLGKNTSLVLVGEAPANNGWRKSHKLWCNVEGKVLPSGVILQKLFNIIDKDIFEMTFLESVKCFPLERKNLKVCSANCKNIMLEQLRIINPDLIITLGEFLTRNLLDFKFDKFSDVVGNVYEANGFKVLPIYHPSPISPKSYKGNEPIFERLKSSF